MLRRTIRAVIAMSLVAVLLLPPPPRVNGEGLATIVPGGLEKAASFEISPPWAKGVEHAITQAYGTGSHLGINRACCNNDHYALDFDLKLNEAVFPVAAGKVLYAGLSSGPWLTYGSIVIVEHPNGYQSLYAHLNSIAVVAGATVNVDSSLGGAGGTGGSPVHLHFALYKNASYGLSPLGGLGLHGGNAVLPEPFANCSKANSVACGNLAKGDHLVNQAGVSLFDMNKGPVPLIWNHEPDAKAFHLRVVPLHGDGPGVDLVISDPASVAKHGYAVLPPVLGQGNYVLLPGATYRWQVRFHSLPPGAGAGDAVWGPWSGVREFRTTLPDARSIGLRASVGGANGSTPTIHWIDIQPADFYYEIQLSVDPQFRMGEAAVAPVYSVLVHGGMSNPLNSWTVPPGYSLSPGLHSVRIRQRVQATPAGPEETGIPWSAPLGFRISAR